MNYKLAIFDMDGTLADTSEGIMNSHRYTHKMMGLVEPSDEDLDGVIGGPLLQTYQNRFGFSEKEAKNAVKIYRERYAEKGIYEAKLYEGMQAVLTALKNSHVKLGVATLKAERFAKTMLADMGVASLFDVIYGVDDNDKRTKSELIQLCMHELNMSPKNTVMIGDSMHDLNGAMECDIAFIGVTYGFGFKKNAQNFNYPLCDTPNELLPYILGKGESCKK